MVIDDLRNREFLTRIFPELKKAFDFILNIRSLDYAQEKKYEIDDNMYAVVGTNIPKTTLEQKLEVHKKYVDLQYVIKGREVIGWKSLNDCKDVLKEYDEAKDIAFFNESSDFNVVLKEGCFALFFPHDAHSPLRGNDPVSKCIIKIKTELF